jgi:alpha,alpha-trehalase
MLVTSTLQGRAASMLQEWIALDDRIRSWWDADLVDAHDPRRSAVASIPLPRPYVAGAAPTSPPWYTTMFSWDTYFTNLALLVHDRPDLVRDHIENYLAMIGKYGYMPNGNDEAMATRSQVPLFPDSIWRYLVRTADGDLLRRAYQALCEEYRGYWSAPHHATDCGLATNADLGDPVLDWRLAAEAETGLDWTSLWEGDVTATAPVMTNSALVRYAEVLAAMASALGRSAEAMAWRQDAEQRAARIRSLCWDESTGFFYDYMYREDRHVRQAAVTGFWPLWAGVASADQARRAAASLPRFLHPYGLATTETAAPSPYGDLLEKADLQWMYPAGWPPLHIMTCWALDRYGLAGEARRSVTGYLASVLGHYQADGELYEKYNVVDGTLELPNARYGTITLHGWTSASVVLLGRRLFHDAAIDEQVPGTA